MRVGIIQPNYIPWRGYFDFTADCDLFILLDDAQYTDRDWRNRNAIKTPKGLTWLTVSLRDKSRAMKINEVTIDWSEDWAGRQLNLLRENYRAAPFYGPTIGRFKAILDERHARLVDLDTALIRWIMTELGITTPLRMASDLNAVGQKDEKLIALVKAVGGNIYLSGPSAENYIDPARFAAANIALEYKVYDYAPYPQLWGNFVGGVSVLDLMMNLGPEAKNHLRSHSPNRRVQL
jgi:hypothetical protein